MHQILFSNFKQFCYPYKKKTEFEIPELVPATPILAPGKMVWLWFQSFATGEILHICKDPGQWLRRAYRLPLPLHVGVKYAGGSGPSHQKSSSFGSFGSGSASPVPTHRLEWHSFNPIIGDAKTIQFVAG